MDRRNGGNRLIAELHDHVAGPVGIAQLTGQAAQAGLSQLLHFTGFLSLNLGILNLLLEHELPRSALGARAQRVASWAMNLGNIFLPITLCAAGAYRPIKYLLPPSALCVFLALLLAAYGTWPSGSRR